MDTNQEQEENNEVTDNNVGDGSTPQELGAEETDSSSNLVIDQ